MEDVLIEEVERLRAELDRRRPIRRAYNFVKRCYRFGRRKLGAFYHRLKDGTPREKNSETESVTVESTEKGRVDIINVNFYDWDGKVVYRGGAERYIYDLAVLLKNMGFKPRILQGANFDFERDYRGFKVIGCKGNIYDQRGLGRIFNERCKGAEFVIASPNPINAGITDIPCIGIHHCIQFDRPDNAKILTELPPVLENPYKVITDAVDNSEICVCTDTSFVSWMRTRDFELSKKVRYIPNYYDEEVFKPTEKKAREHTVFVFPRRIEESRGHKITIEAFGRVLKKYPDTELRLIGQIQDDEARKDVEDILAQYPNNVSHTEYKMQDSYKAFRDADVMLAPTICSDGEPLACIEAMGSGLPIIATTVGGLPNLVVDNYNGFLIPTTVDDLEKAMLEMIEKPEKREKMGERSLEMARAGFRKSLWETRWREIIQDFTSKLSIQPDNEAEAEIDRTEVDSEQSKKVLVVFGTRPEAIKMAPVVKELEQRDGVEPIVCVTAQHRKMLDQVLEIFKITPDYDLDIMEPEQTLTTITSKVLVKFEEVLTEVNPDLVLVHGDTTTAMAACLAAFYQQIPVGHVEAGLRTYDKYAPFPEETNRQAIDSIADLLFAPTETSAENLRKKLNTRQEILVTGNTAIDALKTTVSEEYQHEIFDWVGDSRMILLTAHRRENLGEPMRRIFAAVKKILQDFPDVKVVYPVHLNPKVQSVAKEVLGDEERVRLIEPLDVLDFHNFMEKAYLVLSDSGGVQEEAPALGKPVLVLRDTTERPEGIEAGTLKLVGTDTDDIYTTTKELLDDSTIYAAMAQAKNPYGDGEASGRIVDAIIGEK